MNMLGGFAPQLVNILNTGTNINIHSLLADSVICNHNLSLPMCRSTQAPHRLSSILDWTTITRNSWSGATITWDTITKEMSLNTLNNHFLFKMVLSQKRLPHPYQSRILTSFLAELSLRARSWLVGSRSLTTPLGPLVTGH